MGRTRRLAADSALALTLAARTWGTIELDQGCGCERPWWAVAVILAQTLPLAVRRVAPVPVWLLVGLATGVHGASELADPPVFLAPWWPPTRWPAWAAGAAPCWWPG